MVTATYLQERLDFVDVWLESFGMPGDRIDTEDGIKNQIKHKNKPKGVPVLIKVVMLNPIPYAVLDFPIVLKLVTASAE